MKITTTIFLAILVSFAPLIIGQLDSTPNGFEKILESAANKRVVVISDEIYFFLRDIVSTSSSAQSAKKRSGKLSVMLKKLPIGGEFGKNDWKKYQENFLSKSKEEFIGDRDFYEYEKTFAPGMVQLLRDIINKPGFYAWVEAKGQKALGLAIKYIPNAGPAKSIPVEIETVSGEISSSRKTEIYPHQIKHLIIQRKNNDEMLIALHPQQGEGRLCHIPRILTPKEIQNSELESRVKLLEKLVQKLTTDLNENTSKYFESKWFDVEPGKSGFVSHTLEVDRFSNFQIVVRGGKNDPNEVTHGGMNHAWSTGKTSYGITFFVDKSDEPTKKIKWISGSSHVYSAAVGGKNIIWKKIALTKPQVKIRVWK